MKDKIKRLFSGGPWKRARVIFGWYLIGMFSIALVMNLVNLSKPNFIVDGYIILTGILDCVFLGLGIWMKPWRKTFKRNGKVWNSLFKKVNAIGG